MSQSKYRLALKGVDADFYSAFVGNPKKGINHDSSLRIRYLPGAVVQGHHRFLPIWVINTDDNYRLVCPQTGCDSYIEKIVLVKAHVNDLRYISIANTYDNITDTIAHFEEHSYNYKDVGCWGVRKCVVLAEVPKVSFERVKDCLQFYSKQFGIPAATSKDFCKPAYTGKIKF